MFSVFKEKKCYVYSPTVGKLMTLSEVDDPVFSTGMMGPGFAIDPISEEVFAPIEGKITSIFPTKHAIGIKTAQGMEVLIHIGIDTVDLNGKGFDVKVNIGDVISKKTLLVKMDHEYLKKEEKSPIVMVLFPEKKEIPSLDVGNMMLHQEIFYF